MASLTQKMHLLNRCRHSSKKQLWVWLCSYLWQKLKNLQPMESQNQPSGFWSQLTPVSKFLIFLLVLGVLGASAYYIFMGKDTQPTAESSAVATDSVSSSATDDVAEPSTNASTPVENTAKDENIATDTKSTEPAVVAPKKMEAKKAAALPQSKKPAVIVKKRTSEPKDNKPKKKSKNNEDVEVDI
ncbi:MAG: hypothetical protein EAZ14_05990 [Runella slithyformis]|nr:MAG: hypothetical protein EAZ14_05990 [Runella slithyformis]